MNSRLVHSLLAFALGLAGGPAIAAGPRALNAGEIPWQTDPQTGIARASLLGARTEAGPFVQRVRLPPNFRAGLHRHDADLSATVLAGTIHFRFGDGPEQVMRAGSFIFVPAGIPHDEWAGEAGAEFEVRGIGPQSTEKLVAPAKP